MLKQLLFDFEEIATALLHLVLIPRSASLITLGRKRKGKLIYYMNEASRRFQTVNAGM